ncbi:MAG: uracil-DNA glycosylase [Bacilli bacterium]|jgi:uracil-DNA glycosylase|nr:uracil-DNA glycosylase [Bacilli bacterium]
MSNNHIMTKEEITASLSTFPGDWDKVLEAEKGKEYFQKLIDTISDCYLKETVYPPYQEVFNAFKLTGLNQIKAVIIGQDPYFNPGQANGLAFSVGQGVSLPPSLQNIYKELFYEFGYPVPKTGSLEGWAKQGVLLLNASLTVQAGNPNSHSKLGWTTFTDDVISLIDSLDKPMVYLLWGKYAQDKASMIKSKKACLIKTAHPSPMSATRGFFCSDCFKRANKFLLANKIDPIDWKITD